MTSQVSLWRSLQRENFTSLDTLSAFLELDEKQRGDLLERRHFPLNLPLRLAQKIEKGTLDDPILRQFVPLKAELEQGDDCVKDPVGDRLVSLSPKYLKKYEGRVLIMPTGACAMHCRYCFRQNYDYSPLQAGLAQELAWVGADASIQEVILSGGDPLSLSNPALKEILDSLQAISHVNRIRFHTRFPIGIPERIDAEFLAMLAGCTKQVWFVIHCNHPRELDQDVLAALKEIQKLGIPILNQCVLLQGVNDSIETLQELCERLADHGILPYYLHQLDRVEGAAHFAVAEDRGRQLIAELTKRLSGYAVPKYVQEISGQPSKTAIS